MNNVNSSYLFDECDSCDERTIVQEVNKILDDAKIKSFVYLGLRMPSHNVPDQDLPLILTNMPPSWKKAYWHENRHLCNPTMKRACTSRVPLLMTPGELEQEHLSPAAARPTSGVVVPVHGPEGELALFSLMGQWDATRALPDGLKVSEVHILALNIHATVTECALKQRAPDFVSLTAREQECLLLTARGKTAWEISKIMARSRGTVNFHLQNAMRKLDSVNKTQAAAKATALGLLSG